MIIALSPWQITCGVTVGLMVGVTVIVVVAVSLHPLPLETTTEYVVEAVGEILMEEVVAPVLHEYVPPPPAVNVNGLPAQIVVEEVTVALGEELIVTTAV